MIVSPPNPRPPEAPVIPREPSLWLAWRGSFYALLLIGSLWAACLAPSDVWSYTGIGATPVPFLDLYGSLATGEVAHAHGDPYQPNTLDPFHRPHLYSRWWLVTADLGLTRADTLWLGYTLLGVTLLAALALLRPQNKREILQTALLLCSPALLMAVSRANNDLVIFIVVSTALGLLRFSAAIPRVLAAALFSLAAVLKYYPLAALVVLFAVRSKRERVVALLILGAVLLLGWPALQPALATLSLHLPRPGGFYAFGAGVLPREFTLLSPAWWLVPAALLAVWSFALAARRWIAPPHPNATLHFPPNEAPPPSAAPLFAVPSTEFACGAAFVVGCFFLGASYVYKLIFAVWLLPWLWRAPTTLSLHEARWRRATVALLFAVTWWEGLLAVFINVVVSPFAPTLARSVYDVTFVVSQLLTWGLVVCLSRYLVLYAVEHTRDLRRASRAPLARPS